MSLTRIHNLSISLDGFATGEPQSAEAPFGHAGQRLHQWMIATKFWDPDGGTDGVDNAFAQRHGPGIGAEIMGANKFGPPGWQDDPRRRRSHDGARLPRRWTGRSHARGQVPILLGRGVRLWDGLEALEESYDIETVSSPSGVTHLTFTRKLAS
jgi:hypothetical protein